MLPLPPSFFAPLVGCDCILCNNARKEAKEKVERANLTNLWAAGMRLPFDEPAKAEQKAPDLVYTHVLVDYDEYGSILSGCAELHTPASLIEAIAYRKDDNDRFQVFALGESILDVEGA